MPRDSSTLTVTPGPSQRTGQAGANLQRGVCAYVCVYVCGCVSRTARGFMNPIITILRIVRLHPHYCYLAASRYDCYPPLGKEFLGLRYQTSI